MVEENNDINQNQPPIPPHIRELMKRFEEDIKNSGPPDSPNPYANTDEKELNVISVTNQNTQKDHQVRSDSYKDFISIQPKFFERWGVFIIAAFLACIFVSLCFINYPEVIKGNIKVQSINAPKAIIPKVSGKVVKLLKENNEFINKGENILFIESTANHQEVLAAYEMINQLISQLNNNRTIPITNSNEISKKNKGEIYTSNTNGNEIAPAENIPEVKGLFYTMQIGTFSQPVKASNLSNIQPLYNESGATGIIKYYAGIYYTYEKIVEAQNLITKMGIKQSFIKAFNNNQPVTISEAKRLEPSSNITYNYGTKKTKTNFNLFEGNYSQFGELQGALQTFQTSYLSYLDYQTSGLYEKKKQIIQNDIEILNQLIGINNSQKMGADDELKYVEEKSKNNNNLYKAEVIAREDYVNVYLTYLAKKNSMYQFDLTTLNYASQINQKLRELMEIEDQTKKQNQLLSESIKTLKSQFDEWIDKHIIKAPEKGLLSYATFIQENQMIDAGKSIAMVIPNNSKSYVEMYIPQNIYPKVKLNQRVLLKFPAFPSQDYGYAKGIITYVAPISNDSTFLAKINCDNGFETNQRIKLNVKHGMTGVGEIIVKDKTIMGRLISKFTERFQ